jgi:16S rRNA (cytidine1402-2'-O)-methyltransferase
MSKLYIVATPIGNLSDITIRAIDTLKAVDFILAEDTRVTKRLLAHYDIQTPVISYPADDRKDKIQKFIEMLEAGKNLALVTDAGTPGISDPGSELVKAIRNQGPSLISRTDLEEIEVVPIPGASALTAALSASGLNTSEFIFLGFLPHKKGRETLFKEIGEAERTVVFYESPHRILKTLESLVKFAPNKKVMIARELTKMFEQFVNGTPGEVLKYFIENEDKVRGEFVVIVS